jgi:lipoprotein-releasing system permease protein
MTLFAWLAIAVGVWAMVSFLSIMFGFETSLKERVLKAYPHVMVKRKRGSAPIAGYDEWTRKLGQISGVTKVVPYAEAEMIVQSDRRTLGGIVWGMPVENLDRFRGDMVEGKLPNPASKTPQVVLGRELAHRLGLETGGELRLVSPTQMRGAMGLVPQSQVFQVSGLYASGHYEFDQQYVFLILEDAQDLLKWKGAISGWHLWTDTLERAEQAQKDIEPLLPPEWEAESWTRFNEALFSSLKLEQYAMFAILSFAILIAVMNIVITLMMHVTHKRRNIGILRALGASKAQIKRVFFWQGAYLGLVGLALGAAFTVVFLLYLRFFSTYLLPEIYYDRTVPIELRPGPVILIYVVATVMIFLATLVPSSRAAAIDPIEAIRE